MTFYNNILHSLYNILKSFEGGFSYQTSGFRAFEVVVVISFFEMFNLMSILPELAGDVILVPFSLLLIFNYLAFCFQGRYKKIVTSFTNKKAPRVYLWITILYLLATILAFWKTRAQL